MELKITAVRSDKVYQEMANAKKVFEALLLALKSMESACQSENIYSW